MNKWIVVWVMSVVLSMAADQNTTNAFDKKMGDLEMQVKMLQSELKNATAQIKYVNKRYEDALSDSYRDFDTVAIGIGLFIALYGIGGFWGVRVLVERRIDQEVHNLRPQRFTIHIPQRQSEAMKESISQLRALGFDFNSYQTLDAQSIDKSGIVLCDIPTLESWQQHGNTIIALMEQDAGTLRRGVIVLYPGRIEGTPTPPTEYVHFALANMSSRVVQNVFDLSRILRG